MSEKQYFQVMTEDRYGCPVCDEWFTSEDDANKCMKEREEFFPNSPWWVEEGTDHILHKCKECQDPEAYERHDHYGITTGYWCDECYENKYPYRKDAYYDYFNAGERMEPDF